MKKKDAADEFAMESFLNQALEEYCFSYLKYTSTKRLNGVLDLFVAKNFLK